MNDRSPSLPPRAVSPSLREQAQVITRLLAELRRATEHDLRSRSANTAERDRLTAELEQLHHEEGALLTRLERIEATLGALEGAPTADAPSPAEPPVEAPPAL